MPDLANPLFPQLAQTVVVAGREAGYEVVLTDTLGSKDIEQRSIEALSRRAVDGLIWFPVDDDSRSGLASNALPTVVIDRNLDGFDTVLADCAEGGRLAAQLLLALDCAGACRPSVAAGHFAPPGRVPGRPGPIWAR